MRMRETEIHDYARQLLEARGEAAIAEAAQKACESRDSGDEDSAETWRHIEKAMLTMRGPHAS